MRQRPRPRLLLDIKPDETTDVFGKRDTRVNLRQFSHRTFPKHIIQVVAIIVITSVFTGASVFAPVGDGILASTIDDKREYLEDELAELEKQIVEYEQTISVYRKQGASLQGDIGRLQAEIDKINLQIRAIALSLRKLRGQITNTTGRISEVENRINTSRAALGALLQKTYEKDKKGLIEILLENPRLSDFFGNVNDLLLVQDNLKDSVDRLSELRGELITQKELLALERWDVKALKVYQERQRANVVVMRSQKDSLLAVAKGQEFAYQSLLVKTQKSAAQIRARIFRILGGGQMTFEEALNFARFAEQQTGVRAAFTLAVLDRESALGRNVGQCTYHRAMAPGSPYSWRDDITPFLAITRELGMDPDTTLVSCPIVAHGAFGGAMGPAQFIPTTWMSVRDRVAAIIGISPASPWRNLDAFVASALYLRDNNALNNELEAAARYYCGGNWTRSICINFYAKNVLDTAWRFQQDINILEGR